LTWFWQETGSYIVTVANFGLAECVNNEYGSVVGRDDSVTTAQVLRR
jgi:hypothetical protein